MMSRFKISALVMGGSRGIGAAIANRLAREGASAPTYVSARQEQEGRTG
jgi:NAD(P)-dependent dehydrogenase (short-subunit alcohol dehydrogenase family)